MDDWLKVEHKQIGAIGNITGAWIDCVGIPSCSCERVHNIGHNSDSTFVHM